MLTSSEGFCGCSFYHYQYWWLVRNLTTFIPTNSLYDESHIVPQIAMMHSALRIQYVVTLLL